MVNTPALRHSIEVCVTLFPGDSADGFPGTGLNISETGVLIRTDRWEPVGSLLHLTFPAFTSQAEVVWNSEAEGEVGVLLGMKFASMRWRDRERLALMLGRIQDGATRYVPIFQIQAPLVS
jgi:hypothetical protein